MQYNQRYNKTGLQPDSRPAEQVYYFGGWLVGAKTVWCQGFVDRLPYRTCGNIRCIKFESFGEKTTL